MKDRRSRALPGVAKCLGIVLALAAGGCSANGSIHSAGGAAVPATLVRTSAPAGSVFQSGAGTGAATALSISTPPVSQDVSYGGTAIFAVAATGSNLTYQWYRNGQAIGGATSLLYIIYDVEAPDGGIYDVQVSNGSQLLMSPPALLTVANVPTVPVISLQPGPQAIPSGGNAQFQVIASGAGLSYQWYLNGAPVTGATASLLLVSGVSAASAGTYTVAVSNSAGSVKSQGAALTLAAPSQSCPAGQVPSGLDPSITTLVPFDPYIQTTLIAAVPAGVAAQLTNVSFGDGAYNCGATIQCLGGAWQAVSSGCQAPAPDNSSGGGGGSE